MPEVGEKGYLGIAKGRRRNFKERRKGSAGRRRPHRYDIDDPDQPVGDLGLIIPQKTFKDEDYV